MLYGKLVPNTPDMNVPFMWDKLKGGDALVKQTKLFSYDIILCIQKEY